MMVRKSKGIGERHQRILDFIQEYQRKHKHPPSIREIGESCGISSTSVVNYYLDQLEKAGHIERDRHISRGLRITGQSPIGEMFRVPVLGSDSGRRTHHGPRFRLQLPRSGRVRGDRDFADARREKGKDLFALEVHGNSMIDAMVNDGDIVVMKPAQDAKNGDMVAVWLPDRSETTLKYFYKERDRFRLQPANPTMKPIYVNKADPLEIRGKVVMVIRKIDMPA